MNPMNPSDAAAWADAIDAGPAPTGLGSPEAATPTETSATIDGGPAPSTNEFPRTEAAPDEQLSDGGAAPDAPPADSEINRKDES
jgi:hypothetical protein